MNLQSLHALIIDRHFGELSPEAAELLDFHLAQNAEARAEAERVLQTLGVTREAVLRHPELARVTAGEKPPASPVSRSTAWSWLARAAALVLFAALASTAGFMAGRTTQSPAASTAEQVMSSAPRKSSPWARYRMTLEPNGMQVVRVETSTLESKSHP